MGTSGVILKSRCDFSVEKLLSEVMIVTFRAKLNLYFHNSTEYNDDGSFKSTSLNISDKPLYQDNALQLLFRISEIKKECINEYGDTEFDWVDKGKKLYYVACIENISTVEKLSFKFIYQYLKLNPNDYFWVDWYKWAFSLEDMEKLKKLPYDPDWCYKDPKLIPAL